MFTSKHFLFILSSFLATTNAAPSTLGARAPDAAATVEICTSVDFTGTCVTISIVSDECINLTGGLSILNQEVSSAVVPGGFICTFFEDAGCLSAGSSQTDEVALQGGNWPDFRQIQGIFGSQSFNDLTSSLVCTPV